MNSFLLIWDSSDESYNPDDYADDIAATSREERISTWWSFGTRRHGAEKGDRVYLLRQYNDRGIVASGHLESGNVTERPHWDDPKKTVHTVDVSWDSVMPPEDRLAIEDLLDQVDGHNWNNVYGSGQLLKPQTATKLEEVWRSHLEGVGHPLPS